MKGLITGAALIASTLYAPIQAHTSTDAVILADNSTPAITVTLPSTMLDASTTVIASSTTQFKDNTGLVAYVKKEYANEPILIDIARCESAFRQYDDKTGVLLHGKANPADVGVMQINAKYHLEKAAALGFDINTVEGNVAYAKYLYDNQGAAPWSASESCWSVAYSNSQALAVK